MKHFSLIIIYLLVITPVFSQYKEFKTPQIHSEEWQTMNQSKKDTKEWFKDAKYGMFIHWGLYSIPGGIWKGEKIHNMRPPYIAEWIMYAAKIPRAEYEQLATQFNPTKFDAEAIAKLAKDAGMKYIVITSKHHDGFALFDSKVSEYDIMDASPFKRDIIKELHAACKKYGLEFGLYYSHNIDWHDASDNQSELSAKLNPNISEHAKTFGSNIWDPSPNSFEDYLKGKALPQVKEIMNQYSDLKLLWYDMPWRMNADQCYDFYKVVYDIQPQVLINERIGQGFGDYLIPSDNEIPIAYGDEQKPWETVGTFNNSWGFNSYDNDWKSPIEILYWLAEVVSRGGNYMLNIGPTEEGIVPKESINNLRIIGKWLSVNGEAIYGTRRWKIIREGTTSLNFKSTEDRAEKGFKNSFTKEDFWFTQKDNNVYAISLAKPESEIVIKSFGFSVGAIKSVEILGVVNVKYKQTKDGLIVNIPKGYLSENGFVVKIEL